MTNFEKFERSHGGRCAQTWLLNTKSIFTLKALYIAVHDAAMASTSRLIGGFVYRAKQLAAPDPWDGLCTRQKGAAGCCMAWLVKTKGVPFVPSGKRGGSLTYKLSPEHVRGLTEAYRQKYFSEGA